MSTVGPVHLEQLYAEELNLFSASSGFKNRFLWRPVADARDTSGAMLLSSPDERSMVGMLWITVDPDCTLQYEVSSFYCIMSLIFYLLIRATVQYCSQLYIYNHDKTNQQVVLSGSNVKNRIFELYIEDSPLLLPGAPVYKRLLEEFEGPTLEGYTIGLGQEELLRLNVNIVHVDLWDPKLGQSILKTEWKHVSYFVE